MAFGYVENISVIASSANNVTGTTTVTSGDGVDGSLDLKDNASGPFIGAIFDVDVTMGSTSTNGVTVQFFASADGAAPPADSQPILAYVITQNEMRSVQIMGYPLIYVEVLDGDANTAGNEPTAGVIATGITV